MYSHLTFITGAILLHGNNILFKSILCPQEAKML